MRQPEIEVTVGAKLVAAIAAFFASVTIPPYAFSDMLAISAGAFLSMAPRAEGQPIQPLNFVFGLAAGIGVVILLRSGDFSDFAARAAGFVAAIVGTYLPVWLRNPEQGAAVVKVVIDALQRILGAFTAGKK